MWQDIDRSTIVMKIQELPDFFSSALFETILMPVLTYSGNMKLRECVKATQQIINSRPIYNWFRTIVDFMGHPCLRDWLQMVDSVYDHNSDGHQFYTALCDFPQVQERWVQEQLIRTFIVSKHRDAFLPDSICEKLDDVTTQYYDRPKGSSIEFSPKVGSNNKGDNVTLATSDAVVKKLLKYSANHNFDLDEFLNCTSKSKLVACGGCVVRAVCGDAWNAADIDVFFVGGDCNAAVEDVFEYLREVGVTKGLSIAVVNHSHVLDIFMRPSRRRDAVLRMQLILRKYSSVEEILVGFDIDCCSFAYDARQGVILGIPRAFAAVKNRQIIVDPTRQSKSLVNRLKKYRTRGFAVCVPVFEWTKNKIFHMTIENQGGIYKNSTKDCTLLKIVYSMTRMPRFSFSNNSVTTVVSIPTSFYMLDSTLYTLLEGLSIWEISLMPCVVETLRRKLNEFFIWINTEQTMPSLSGLKWITENPGKQATGSFNPENTQFYL